MLSFLRNKNLHLTISIFILSTVIFMSCGKKEEPKTPEVTQNATIVDSLFSPENIQSLENSQGLRILLGLKKFGATYTDCIATPAQFEPVTDRKKQLMRFGMLTVDIAYAKIIGGKTQLPEYEKLFERYVKDLNLSSLMSNIFEEFVKFVENKEIDEKLVADLKEKFGQRRSDIINKAKELDPDFLVYFSLGMSSEIVHVFMNTIKADKSNTIMGKFSSMHTMKNTGIDKFFMQLWQHQKYSDYSVKIKPAVEIMISKLQNKTPLTPEEIGTIAKTYADFRAEILK